AEVEGNKAFQSPWSRYNYYPVARKKAEAANVIVTNHSLLCTDMILDYHVLPDFTKMIIDEAHHLEHTVSQKFGLSLDRKSTRLNSSHVSISYAVFCLKKKKKKLQ